MFKVYLKESLIYVIDHFEEDSKRHFNSSFSFMLAVIIAALVIGFIHTLFNYNKKEAFYYYDNKEKIISGLLYWTDSVINLVKVYLPYILGILFVISVYGNKLNKQILKEYKSSIMVAVFLAFCIDNLGTVLIGYINRYIVGLLEGIMPMSAFMLIPGAIKFCMYIGIGAYLNWSVSACLCIPIKLQAENEGDFDQVDEDNTHEADLPH